MGERLEARKPVFSNRIVDRPNWNSISEKLDSVNSLKEQLSIEFELKPETANVYV